MSISSNSDETTKDFMQTSRFRFYNESLRVLCKLFGGEEGVICLCTELCYILTNLELTPSLKS